jgi:hypothetical protein
MMTRILEIWEPRWKDRVVLIAKFKVGPKTYIKFTRAKSLPGLYEIDGEKVKTFPLESNGKIDCYAVPLNELTLIEEEE